MIERARESESARASARQRALPRGLERAVCFFLHVCALPCCCPPHAAAAVSAPLLPLPSPLTHPHPHTHTHHPCPHPTRRQIRKRKEDAIRAKLEEKAGAQAFANALATIGKFVIKKRAGEKVWPRAVRVCFLLVLAHARARTRVFFVHESSRRRRPSPNHAHSHPLTPPHAPPHQTHTRHTHKQRPTGRHLWQRVAPGRRRRRVPADGALDRRARALHPGHQGGRLVRDRRQAAPVSCLG